MFGLVFKAKAKVELDTDVSMAKNENLFHMV